jgi:hypothetical protein
MADIHDLAAPARALRHAEMIGMALTVRPDAGTNRQRLHALLDSIDGCPISHVDPFDLAQDIAELLTDLARGVSPR